MLHCAGAEGDLITITLWPIPAAQKRRGKDDHSRTVFSPPRCVWRYSGQRILRLWAAAWPAYPLFSFVGAENHPALLKFLNSNSKKMRIL